MLDSWRHVTRQSPCPVCGKPDWCIVSPDGDAVICYRVQSSKEAGNGGWLHRLRDAPDWRAPPVRKTRPPPVRRPFDAAAYHARLREAWDYVWLDGLSLSLGVSMDALERLEPAWDARHQAFAFPMRDGDGRIVGIRLRSHEGRKWAVSGSKSGLFYPADIAQGGEVVVLEGPTDTAAALTLGLNAVGRPSCNAGVEELTMLVERLRVKKVTIVSDNDRAHRRPADDAIWRPGSDGAFNLPQKLKRIYRVVVPPCKDFRDWAASASLDREGFETYAKNVKWRLP